MAKDQHERDGSRGSGDQEQGLQRALQREPEDLVGDTEKDRNLTGSTTYETLPDQPNNKESGGQSGRR